MDTDSAQPDNDPSFKRQFSLMEAILHGAWDSDSDDSDYDDPYCFDSSSDEDDSDEELALEESLNALCRLVPDKYNAAQWRDTWKNHPQWWTRICDHWEAQLRAAFFASAPGTEEISAQIAYDNAVLVLRQMRQIDNPPAGWVEAVKSTKLGTTICDIADAATLIDPGNPHADDIFLKIRAHESLCEILDKWVPESSTWARTPIQFKPNPLPHARLFDSEKQGRALWKILTNPKYENIIPHQKVPHTIQLFVSESNFTLAWHTWLALALQHHKFDVTHVQPHNLYSEFMEHLQKQRAQLPNLKNSSLCQILTRTLEVRDYEKIQRDYIYDRVPIKSRKKGKEQRDKQQHQRTTYNLSGEEAFPSDACLECFRLPPEKRCRQKIYVSDQNAEFLRGCGVTRAPEAARMKPGKSPKSRSNKHPPPIFTPEDIQSRGCKFVGYERDEEVMQRCGMQIRFICYASTDELIDVVVYGAFHPEIMKRFKEHSDAPSECKPLTRGGQFDFYSSEKGMTAYGSIVPKGGLPGSGYAPVAGFNTRTSAGIDLVFNEVEVISPVIYYYYSMLIPSADLMAKTEAADRMGKAGLNTYRCDGYYAAQHEDEDACRGIHPTVITCKRIQTRFGRSTEAECMGQCCLQSHRLIKRLYYGCAGAHAVDVALTNPIT
ncbi:hypothetical protein B0H12DRAFT_1229006 [Mycena haematopus]|nr:hypothetical protein B0H12DRAFT_1229006 [Mycena haematopus]